MTAAPDRLTFRAPPARVRFSLFPRVRVQPIVFKEKLTMKTDSWMEEKLECSLWCCLSDPSPPGRCCVPERRIVPWMQQVRVLSSCSARFSFQASVSAVFPL
ncbi:putative ubiquitin-conjugating enzyme E2Q2-like protein isoform X2 [Nomascus leucogenys]|uniref:putative ubiquitin-conjugating enzyme E2Q2-like protein isoform X2 n=1 Tax=Nomascus leucogenys TaxID=61853 RepID=UPI00122D7359|nr:putative ubiquitin-conjugating enzyme E2Q2-like protein isoform X2 [Nomascus leucogenys]